LYLDGITEMALPAACSAQGNDPRTMMLFIKNGRAVDGFQIFSQGFWTAGDNKMWAVVPRTDTSGLTIWGHAHDISTGVQKRFPMGQWHHLAVTWDGREYKFYYDGALAANGITTPFNTQGPTYLGGSNWPQGRRSDDNCAPANCWFKGQTSDFRYFNSVLSAAEIENYAHMTRSAAPSMPPGMLTAPTYQELPPSVFDGTTRKQLPTSCNALRNAPRSMLVYVNNARSIDGFHIFGQGSYGDNTMWVVAPRTDSHGLMVWAHNHDINTGAVRSFPTGQWHHLAVTWDGSHYAFYYDGVLASSGTTTAFNTVSGAWLGGSGFMQGKQTGDNCAPHLCWFKGQTSDFRYFNTALSANEVASYAAMPRTTSRL